MPKDFSPEHHDPISMYVVSLVAKEPMLRWVNKIIETDSELSKDGPVSMEEINGDPISFVVPDFKDEKELQVHLERHKDRLFEMALAEWTLERGLWPIDRNKALFDQWFDFALLTTIYDLGEITEGDSQEPAPHMYN